MMVFMHKGFLPHQHAIDGYASGGFHFANMSHKGSILIVPSGIYAWAPLACQDISPQSLSPLFEQHSSDVDLLIIGTGAQFQPLPEEVRLALKVHAIKFDLMATQLAISTYNILFGEKRRVAAALIAVSS
jgi:uncharacterized protein